MSLNDRADRLVNYMNRFLAFKGAYDELKQARDALGSDPAGVVTAIERWEAMEDLATTLARVKESRAGLLRERSRMAEREAGWPEAARDEDYAEQADLALSREEDEQPPEPDVTPLQRAILLAFAIDPHGGMKAKTIHQSVWYRRAYITEPIFNSTISETMTTMRRTKGWLDYRQPRWYLTNEGRKMLNSLKGT